MQCTRPLASGFITVQIGRPYSILLALDGIDVEGLGSGCFLRDTQAHRSVCLSRRYLYTIMDGVAIWNSTAAWFVFAPAFMLTCITFGAVPAVTLKLT